MPSCDFLVIGAGIAGASAGYELAAQGRVVVLEAEDAAGYHSTGRSAAQFLESYGNGTVRGLTRASRAFYEAPPEGFAAHPLLSPRPAIYIARADQSAELERLIAEVRRASPDIEPLTREEILALVPIVRPDHAAAGAIERGAMDIDTHALHQGYLKGLRARGGEVVLKARVHGLSRGRDSWRLETAVGTFSAPVVVNAAGAWCDEVARLAGVRPIGLVPKRRTVVTLDAPEGLETRDWPLVAVVDESFYFKPDSGRILASPADETPSPPCDARPEELDMAVAVERAQSVTTLQVRRIAHAWAGLRSFAADKSLVIGMDQAAAGFFWLAGQGGYGFQTAPAAARAAAGLIRGTGLPADIAALGLTEDELSPERAALGPHRLGPDRSPDKALPGTREG